MSSAWEIQNLNNVCEVIAGQSPKSEFYNKSGEGLAFYQGKKDFGTKYIKPPTTWTTKITKEAIKDDILMSVRAPVGPINFSTEKICIGRGLAAIRASNKIDKEFLFYFLLKHESEIIGNTGAVFNSINKTQIGAIPTPVPSLDIQKQTVAILDQAFAAIDQAQANIQQNIQNAQDLFQSKLNQIFSQQGEGWEEKTFKEICSIITDGTHQTPKYFDSGYIFLSSKNVTSGKIDWENVKYLDEEQHTKMYSRLAPQINDILLAKNGTTGVAAIVDVDKVFDIYVSLALLRPTEVIYPYYLLHFINSSAAKKQFNKRLKGIGVPNLHLKEIREVIINFPTSIEKQQEISEYIDKLLVQRDLVLANYEKKQGNLEELKKSLLQKAFNGELTRETPALLMNG